MIKTPEMAMNSKPVKMALRVTKIRLIYISCQLTGSVFERIDFLIGTATSKGVAVCLYTFYIVFREVLSL